MSTVNDLFINIKFLVCGFSMRPFFEMENKELYNDLSTATSKKPPNEWKKNWHTIYKCMSMYKECTMHMTCDCPEKRVTHTYSHIAIRMSSDCLGCAFQFRWRVHLVYCLVFAAFSFVQTAGNKIFRMKFFISQNTRAYRWIVKYSGSAKIRSIPLKTASSTWIKYAMHS